MDHHIPNGTGMRNQGHRVHCSKKHEASCVLLWVDKALQPAPSSSPTNCCALSLPDSLYVSEYFSQSAQKLSFYSWYGNAKLFHFHVPEDTVLLRWLLQASRGKGPECTSMEITVYVCPHARACPCGLLVPLSGSLVAGAGWLWRLGSSSAAGAVVSLYSSTKSVFKPVGVICVHVTSGSGAACQVWCPRDPLGHWRELHSEADVLLGGAPGLAEPAHGAKRCGSTTRDLSRARLAGDGQKLPSAEELRRFGGTS